MTNYNRVTMMGRLTRDVELRNTSGGTTVAKCGFAVNRWRKDKDDDVCFVDLVAFGKTAELLSKHFHKGDAIHFEGRLSFSQWDAKDGSGKRSKHEIVVESVQFLPRNADTGSGGGNTEAPTGADYGDIPF